MSTTTVSPTTTTTSPASTTSASIELPTSTVISIGLGFVAVAVGLLCLTVILRAVKVYKQYRVARARGDQTTWLETWRSSGGWWGYFTNGLGGEATLIGGGGVIYEERQRRWLEMMMFLRDTEVDVGKEVGDRPRMFEALVEKDRDMDWDEGMVSFMTQVFLHKERNHVDWNS